jgi:hypothetical protein
MALADTLDRVIKILTLPIEIGSERLIQRCRRVLAVVHGVLF